MSTTGSKIGLTILVIVLIALGVWYATTMTNNQDVYGDVSEQGNAAAATIRPTPPTSIDEDMATIDAQLKAMENDSASIDASLNDTPISQ